MRLIDADALFDSMNSLDYESTVKAYEAIVNAPTIDAVPVVRCKDCKNWTEWENCAGSCQRSDSVMWLGTDATDFCSFAERKDNG